MWAAVSSEQENSSTRIEMIEELNSLEVRVSAMTEDTLSYDEGFDESVEEFFSVAPDSYDCTLQISVPRGGGDYVKKLYSPFLEGMDPTFQFICISERDNVNSPVDCCSSEFNESSSLQCEAISVVLFLFEAFGRLSAIAVQKNFNVKPWKFHHRIELPADARPRVLAQQDFYQTVPGLPLWSICPVHYGNEHLRFHILTRNFTQMRSFYELVTGKKATSGSSGFCYITLYSQSGFDIQLSLKYLPQTCPRPSRISQLKFKIRDMGSVMPYLVEPPVQTEETLWKTCDPDGNEVILEETESRYSLKKVRLQSSTSLETSDYETASLETESLSGSLTLSPQGTLNSSSSQRFFIV